MVPRMMLTRAEMASKERKSEYIGYGFSMSTSLKIIFEKTTHQTNEGRLCYVLTKATHSHEEVCFVDGLPVYLNGLF